MLTYSNSFITDFWKYMLFFFLPSTGLFLTHFTVFNFNLSAFLLEYRKALCVCKICTVMSKRTLNLKLLNRHFFSVLGNFYSQFPFYLFTIRNLKRDLNCKKETLFFLIRDYKRGWGRGLQDNAFLGLTNITIMYWFRVT